MSRSSKVLLIAAGVVGALFLSVGLAGAVVAYRVLHSGIAVVSVHESKPNGTQLWIPVPFGLVETALVFVPRDKLPPIDAEARRCLPIAQSVLAELDRAPDAVLVEVSSPGEHVVVAKRHGRLVVDVHDRGQDVHVSLPAGALQALIASMQDWPSAPIRRPEPSHSAEL
jgi:hypothetical protein